MPFFFKSIFIISLQFFKSISIIIVIIIICLFVYLFILSCFLQDNRLDLMLPKDVFNYFLFLQPLFVFIYITTYQLIGQLVSLFIHLLHIDFVNIIVYFSLFVCLLRAGLIKTFLLFLKIASQAFEIYFFSLFSLSDLRENVWLTLVSKSRRQSQTAARLHLYLADLTAGICGFLAEPKYIIKGLHSVKKALSVKQPLKTLHQFKTVLNQLMQVTEALDVLK